MYKMLGHSMRKETCCVLIRYRGRGARFNKKRLAGVYGDMIIRTESYQDLEEDLSKIMGVDVLLLHKRLHEISKECLDDFRSDWDKYEELIDKLILENSNLNMVDEMYIYHLGRHIEEPKELLPLKDLLLSKNKLSEFLNSYGIVFMDQDGKIDFFHEGRLITAEEILSREHFHLLAKRLGYLGEADFCVNGFSFWPNKEKTSDGYFRDLQSGPEIVENIGRFIGKDLWRDFKEQSKYYGVVFKVPVEDVIMDGRDSVKTKEEKMKCLIKYALFYLNDYYNGCVGGNNLMLRLHDGKKVVVDHCILINE